MAHGAEQGSSPESKKGNGLTRRKFLEADIGIPLFLFGSMLVGIFNKKGVSDFMAEATKTLDFFPNPVGVGGGGGGGGAEAPKASSKHWFFKRTCIIFLFCYNSFSLKLYKALKQKVR